MFQEGHNVNIHEVYETRDPDHNDSYPNHVNLVRFGPKWAVIALKCMYVV